MATLKLSAPWEILYSELTAMFKNDSHVRILFDKENYKISVYADDPAKSEALEKILKPVHHFGNITVYVSVVPPNGEGEKFIEHWQAALDGNDACTDVVDVTCPFGKFKYVVFENEVVQYFTDDMTDLHGNNSTLYQEIAKRIFKEEPGVYFCTALPCCDYVDIPLGEWP